MQSPFSYTDSYSSSPGDMDFFYGSTPGYETLCDLDAASPFAMSEVMPEACSFPSSFTSSPYMIPPLSDTGPIYDVSTIATSVPSSASSTCGSSYGGSMSQAEEVPLPTSNNPWRHYDDSCPDSPPQSKPAKPFACENCGRSFTRFADLKRHQSSVHFPVFRNCPVEHCSRKGSKGFPRQDHLVEHLRSCHHLDVPKRRVLKQSGKNAA